MSTTQQNTQTASIEDTVRTALQGAGYGSYMNYAAPVIGALVIREESATAALVDAGVTLGADEEDVRNAIKASGLSVKDPETEEDEEAAEPAGEGAVATALANIQRTLDSLTEFARRNGYRG